MPRETRELQRELVALSRRNRELQEDVAALRIENQILLQKLAAPKKGLDEATLTGKINAVAPDFMLYSLNLCAADGVKQGDVFEVIRADKVIGRLRVNHVYQTFAAASLLSKKDPKTEFRKQDVVKRVQE